VPFFIAAWFGVSGSTDVFFFAYGIIIYLSGIFSNSIESSIVPFIAEVRSRDEKQVGFFVGKVLTIGVVTFLIAGAIFLTISRPLLGIVTNFSSWQLTFLLKILTEMLPLLILLIATSILSGVLNAYKIFIFPAVLPAFRAAVILSAIFSLKSKIGVHAIALGYVLGEAFRLCILWSTVLHRKLFSIRFSLVFDTESLNFLKTFSHLVIGLAALGLNSIIDKVMASWLQEGSVSVLEYADRLYMIPVALLSSGFIVTTLSHWSKTYYENGGNKELFKEKIMRAAKLLLVVSLAVTIFLAVFSKPLIGFVYGYGQFPKDRLAEVRWVWLAYLAGFAPFTLCQLFVIRRLVMKETLVPMKIALIMNILNVALNLILMRVIGLPGIALATSITYLVADLLYLIL